MLDHAVVCQQADVGVTHLLRHLELIDARRRKAAAAMHRDRYRKYCRRRTHCNRWPPEASNPPSSRDVTAPRLNGAEFAPQLDTVLRPIGRAHTIDSIGDPRQ